MLSLRTLLAVLIVAATALFVIGVSVERSEGNEATATHVESGDEGSEEEDEAVLGLDLESTPFIVLAALASLGLAAAAWMRPRYEPLLLVVALAMLAFAVFDIAEAAHQIEESEGGLAVVAGLVAVLHLAASAVAFAMRRQATESAPA